MRILIVYPRLQFYGGAELLIVRLANYLAKIGVSHALCTAELHPEIRREFHHTEFILSRPEGTSRPEGFKGIITDYLSLRKSVKKERNRFDLINVHNYPAELCTFPISKPVVWMCNEPPEVAVNARMQSKNSRARWTAYRSLIFAERQIVRKYIRSAVVADEFSRQRFERLYGFTPHVIPYGVDIDFFNNRPTPTDRSGNGHARFTMLHVGVITPLKNQMKSVETLEALLGKIPGIRLVLAGKDDGPYADRLRTYFRDRGLSDHITFTGHINRDELKKWFFSADVLIHPVKSQGGWLSPFEALCTGIPIIVSREMTASQIVCDNDIGVVTDDFETAVLSAYRNYSAYKAIADKGSRWVKQNLSWDRFSESMMEVFQSTLDNKQCFWN